MLDVFLTSLKALVCPKEFINLAYKKKRYMFLYVFIMSVIADILFLQPFYKHTDRLIEAGKNFVEQKLPDFELKDGMLTANNDKKYTEYLDDDTVLIFMTSLDTFTNDQRDRECFIHYLDSKQYNQIVNGVLDVVMFSKTSYISISGMQYGQVYYKDLLKDAEYLQNISRDEIMDGLSKVLPFVRNFYAVCIVLGMFISPFWQALFLGLIMKFVNFLAKGNYPYGYLYRAAVYFTAISNVFLYLLNIFTIKLLIDVFMDKTLVTSGMSMVDSRLETLLLVSKILLVLTFAYPIAAVIHKVTSDGPFQSVQSGIRDIKYTPGGYAVGDFSTNSDWDNEMFSSEPLDPFELTPSTPVTPQNDWNTGYNPNSSTDNYYRPNQDNNYTERK